MLLGGGGFHMPPEPLPWDRKERKHERSASLGPSSFSRWKDHGHMYGHGSSRWGSNDFRRPPGHGRNVGWQSYPEDSAHGLVQSRSNDKILNEENFRLAMSCGDGKYVRNGRESRPLFCQKEWRSHSWETTPASGGLGRPYDASHERSVDNMLTYSSPLQSADYLNSCNRPHFKDQHDRTDGVNGMAPGRRIDKENPLGSLDWKTFKWTRSGSLSSRGSGFTHSSSSKSIGADSNETKVELQPHNMLSIQSPSGDVAACQSSATPSEDTTSRKKPRLGWGEGLAKYERKKVGGVDDSATKHGALICGSNTDSEQSHGLSLPNKSPRVLGFDCGSPATPSSVACSSSPGLEEKHDAKVLNVDNDTSNLISSPGLVQQNHPVGFPFNLENLDLLSVASLSSSISELLQSDDATSMDSDIGKSVVMNKLLAWKGGFSKALEMIESEIDLLENELKSLLCEFGFSVPSVLKENSHESCDEPDFSHLNSQPVSFQPTSLEVRVKRPVDAVTDACHENKDQYVDSPGSATSKLIEPLGNVLSVDVIKQGDDLEMFEKTLAMNVDVNRPEDGVNGAKPKDKTACQDGLLPGQGNPAEVFLFSGRENTVCNSILKFNRETALRASEVFNQLLPVSQRHVDASKFLNDFCAKSDPVIEKRFAMRKRSLRFKERVLTLKFRAFQHLWKEDMRLLSVRKNRVKSHKKFDFSFLTVQNVHQKHRSSIRSRFSFPAGNLSLVPTSEILNFTSKLLTDSQVKPYRKTLKMPALILDENELNSRFISHNGLVEDPCTIEKERSLINPWTSQEKEIFIEKLTAFGKDFRKIASYLDHKTTADCIEFYYKNHKSDCFRKTKKPEFGKQGKSYSTNTYLVASNKRWSRELNAVSSAMLGISPIAADIDADAKIRQRYASKHLVVASSDYRISRADDGNLKKSNSLVFVGNERETAAADVLAGICGSLSSEAMSSCITSSVDLVEGYQEWKCQKVSNSVKRPVTSEVTQNFDDETCSNDSCGETDSTDWTDEEKSIFIHALSSYGKDFDMISRRIRTKSRDQCKVFFSKARKVLGLDMLNPVPGNEGTPVSFDGIEGGSDADDTCALETGSAVCSDKSLSKMSDNLPISDLKTNDELCNPVEAGDLQDFPGENDETQKLSLKNTRLRLDNLVGADSCVVGREECGFDNGSSVDNNVFSMSMGMQVGENVLTSSDAGAVEDEAFEVVGVDRAKGVELRGQEFQLPVTCLDCKDVVRAACTSGLNSPKPGAKPVHRSGKFCKRSLDCEKTETVDVCGSGSLRHDSDSMHQSAALLGNNLKAESGDASMSGLNSSTQALSSMVHAALETERLAVSIKHETELEFDSNQMPYPSLMDNAFSVTNSVPRESGPHIHNCEDTSVTLDLKRTNDQQCQKSSIVDNHHQHLPSPAFLVEVEPSMILKGYPLLMSSKEMRGDVCGKNQVSQQSLSKLHKEFPSGHLPEQKDCFLQRCSTSGQASKAMDLLSRDQNCKQPRISSHSSSVVDKPCRSGDFKLFGQILTHPSSQEKANSTVQCEDKSGQQLKVNGKSFDLKFDGNQCVEGNAAPGARIDRKNYMGLENIPIRDYQFWDKNITHNGFHSLPDSAILLAKYPAAFGNFPSSSKLEQQPLHALVNSSDRSLNGAPVYPSREVGVSNGVADYQAFRSRDGSSVPSFTVDVQQPHNVIFPEMTRQNGFAVSRRQQPPKGMIGINVLDRVIIGGSCTSVSDPVAAIKMHYANTEPPCSGPTTGSVIREEDCRRGKGDLGR